MVGRGEAIPRTSLSFEYWALYVYLHKNRCLVDDREEMSQRYECQAKKTCPVLVLFVDLGDDFSFNNDLC